MAIINELRSFAEFDYWFLRTTIVSFAVVDVNDPLKPIGMVYESNEIVITLDLPDDDPEYNSIEANIREDFIWYRTGRYEYLVGRTVDTFDKETYEQLIIGCALCKAFKNLTRGGQQLDRLTFDDNIKYMDVCINWLNDTDFYQAPASTRYHESFVGGLLQHTLNVVNRIVDLRGSNSFKNVNVEDAVLVALVHDWCKIGFYESYQKNVKDQQTGQWHTEVAFKRREHSYINLGHGVSSMYLASKIFKLSYEESLAIRWHMGRWRCSDDEINELQECNEQFPIVHLLQFADQLAIVNY